MSQHLTLKWEKFGLSRGLNELLGTGELVDVTLACQGELIQAHKTVLAACSPHFRAMFKGNPCQHPIIFMHDVQLPVLHALIDFMYEGEVTVSELDLPGVLKIADALNVSGLASTSKEFQEGEEVETFTEQDQEDEGPYTAKIPRHKNASADVISSPSRAHNEQQWMSSTDGASKTQISEPMLTDIKVEAEDLLELHDNPIETNMQESDDEDDIEEHSVDTPDLQEEAQEASWTDPGPSTSSSPQQLQQPKKNEQQQCSTDQTQTVVSGVSSRGRILHSVERRMSLPVKKKFPGKICKKSLKTKQSSLRYLCFKHLQNGSASRKAESYSCVHCNIQFPRFSKLRQHNIIHHYNSIVKNRDRYSNVCKFCNANFRLYSELAAHMEKEHGIQRDIETTSQRLYIKQCLFCFKKFESAFMRNNHIATEHPELRYPCRVCSNTFSMKETQIRHELSVHRVNIDNPEKIFFCDHCNNVYSLQRYLDFHMKSRHPHLS